MCAQYTGSRERSLSSPVPPVVFAAHFLQNVPLTRLPPLLVGQIQLVWEPVSIGIFQREIIR